MISLCNMIRLFSARLVLAVIVLAISIPLTASIIGTWNGKLSVRGVELPVVFNFTEAGDSLPLCTMDSPAQGAKDIPVDIEFLSDDSVKISVNKLLLSYEGIYDADSISGMFRQGFTRLPLTLVRGDVVLRRPQMPQSPFPYSVEEVRFCNDADSAVLAGSLVVPNEDVAIPGSPVVIMVTGSGQQNRDEELLGHKPFLVIADYLARHGIASLRYDDRGHASSTGDISNATTATFAADARSGIELLRRDGRFGKVGVLGHSEGGQIAYVLASDGSADFAVSLAGPALRGDSLLLYQNFELLCPSVGDSVAADYCRALEHAFRYAATSEGEVLPNIAKAEVDRILTEKAISLPANLSTNLGAVIVQTSRNPWMKYFISFDPTDAVSAITVPVMAVVGSLDRQVSAAPTIAALAGRLISDGSVIKEYPGLNHMFQHATTGMPDEYGNIEETISEEVLSDIVAFVEAVSSSSR